MPKVQISYWLVIVILLQAIVLAALPVSSVRSSLNNAERRIRISLNHRGLADDDGYVIPELVNSQYIQTAQSLARESQVCTSPESPFSFADARTIAPAKRAIPPGRIRLYSVKELSLYVPITIGKQKFKFVVDTLSQETLLPSNKCSSSWCKGKTLYTPTREALQSNLVDLSYGQGLDVITGKVHAVDVKIGTKIMITNIAIFVADTLNERFRSERFPADGLLSMAPVSSSEMLSQPTLIQQMVLQYGIEEKFALKVDTRKSCYSEMSLGYDDNALYTGDIQYIPVVDGATRWTIMLDSIHVKKVTKFTNSDGSESSHSTEKEASGGPVSIHTGAQISYFDKTIMAKLKPLLPGIQPAPAGYEGHYTIPCSGEGRPEIHLKFGGRLFPMHSDTLSIGRIDTPGSQLCLCSFADTPLKGMSTLGLSFLLGTYSVYRKNPMSGKLEVGLAPVKWESKDDGCIIA